MCPRLLALELLRLARGDLGRGVGRDLCGRDTVCDAYMRTADIEKTRALRRSTAAGDRACADAALVVVHVFLGPHAEEGSHLETWVGC